MLLPIRIVDCVGVGRVEHGVDTLGWLRRYYVAKFFEDAEGGLVCELTFHVFGKRALRRAAAYERALCAHAERRGVQCAVSMLQIG